MRQPPGYEQGNKVCLLKESLYCLKWYRRFDEYMLSNGFKHSSYDGIDNRKSVKMSLGGHFKMSLKDFPVTDCDVERMSKVPYANAVRILMYLMVCTRPDIAYA
nr:hypothetical protein [Tanacetum cinerariifolium]